MADPKADILQSPLSESNKRQAAILERHLPEGYSADPEVSLGVQGLSSTPPRSTSTPEAFPFPDLHQQTATATTTAVSESNNTQALPSGPEPGSGSGSGYGTTNNDSAPESANAGNPDENPEVLESSLLLQGGDIHRDIFKIKARASSLRRANTFSHGPSPRLQAEDGLTYPEQREPGGFRRHYLRNHARRNSGPLVIANSFVDFLDLYGSFAGEDLEDTDTEEESAIDDEEEANENRPLLSRPGLRKRRRSSHRHTRAGEASTLKTFFTLLKAFIGTGIMFLPMAFRNGGILFSSLTLIGVSLVNCLCFRLLLDCRQMYGGGYGELGEAIVGPRFRSLILASITISQLGFVCAGLVFTAENLWAVLDAVTGGGLGTGFNVPVLIALQLIPLIPLALIRHISKLGLVALIADVFILVGLVYIWYYDIASLASRGMDPTVKLFNPSNWTLTIGSAIFTFEGIGLILPIQSSMKKPQHFGPLLYLVMFLITIIFTSVAALCYATFGERTKIQVISNFPQDSPLVNVVQFLYSLAVLAGEPVQLFPAVRILETSLFGERASGAKSAAVKWQKNGLRMLAMGLCVGVAIVGATDLDKFVSLVGSFACVPLVYIYPAYLHYKGAATKPWVKAFDLFLVFVGLVVMVYTTIMAVLQWIEG